MPEIVRDRDELLLNAIVTGDATDIDPRDREEKFLKAIADKIGSGGGATEYLHQIKTTVQVQSMNVELYIDIINESSTPIESGAAIISNIHRVVSVTGQGRDSNAFGYVLIQRITAPSESSLRYSGIRMYQAETMVMNTASASGNIYNATFTDTVTQL